MQQLGVRRLDPTEHTKFVDTIPHKARIRWVCRYLGKSDRTVARYRQLLFSHCLEYQTLTCSNGLDNNILLSRQVHLISELSDLMDEWRDVKLALEFYGRNHRSPGDA